jgi:hypothetical protein
LNTRRQDLHDLIWDSLPILRRNLVGRRRIERVVDLCIDRAPLEVLPYVGDRPEEQDVVAKAWQNSVKGLYCREYGEDAIQFGPLFWIVVSPMIQFAIKKIIEWFWQSKANRVMLAGWRREGWR